MAISVEDDLAVLRDIQAKAAQAAPEVVWAMARLYTEDVKAELHMRAHASGTWTNAPPWFSPPSYISGDLERSVLPQRGLTTGMVASATVAPHTVYASVQEWGRIIRHRAKKYEHWVNDHGAWFKKEVFVPPRPYMRPALEVAIASGGLRRVAMEAFETEVWD